MTAIYENGECICAWCKPRERWQFLGRERHYGFDYLIWTLAANPRAPRTLGTRWARVV